MRIMRSKRHALTGSIVTITAQMYSAPTPNDGCLYRIGKITFNVTPVYKDKKPGETIRDILIKLMRADIERT